MHVRSIHEGDRRRPVLDLLFLLLIFGFYAASWGLADLCARVRGKEGR